MSRYAAVSSLYTETTGLGSNDEIIEVCLIDLDGTILLNTLIKPAISISDAASRIHGIYDQDVENAPFWEDVYEDFINIIKDKKVNIYNSEFDIKMLNRTSYPCGFKTINHIDNKLSTKHRDLNKFIFINYHCVMLEYADIWGDYHEYYNNNRWQSLSDAAEQQSIDISDLTTHRAYADCEITRRLLLKMNNNECIEDPCNEVLRNKKEKTVKRAAASKKYREKANSKKWKLIPKNRSDYENFGSIHRPDGYKTFSQLKVSELHLFEYAGTCCTTYGDQGHIFKPKKFL
jgi:DNA polymerase-3 subunit epsilon